MTQAAAVVAIVVMVGITVVQVLAATGRPYGHLLWGGQHRVLPRHLRIGSALSPLLYLSIALVLLGRAGMALGDGEGGFLRVAAWVLVGYFGLGVIMNFASRSPAERWTMGPACAVLTTCSLVVALS